MLRAVLVSRFGIWADFVPMLGLAALIVLTQWRLPRGEKDGIATTRALQVLAVVVTSGYLAWLHHVDFLPAVLRISATTLVLVLWLVLLDRAWKREEDEP